MVKVTRLRSRIYTHLKSNLIQSQRMFRKTAVLNVSENSQRDDFIGVLLKYLELSNLPPRIFLANTYHKKKLHCNWFLRAFRDFLRLLGERFWWNHVLIK